MDYPCDVDEENVYLNNTKNGKETILSSITNIFSNNNEVEENNLKNKVLDIIEVEKSYTWFFVLLAFGAFFIFLSLIFLPFIIISPQKFVSLFSLGTLMINLSFIFIHGTKEYFKLLFATNRILFTVLYLCSIILGIYFSFVDSWFIISHICAAFQLLTLIVFVLSFLPGGELGIKFIWSSIKSLVIRNK